MTHPEWQTIAVAMLICCVVFALWQQGHTERQVEALRETMTLQAMEARRLSDALKMQQVESQRLGMELDTLRRIKIDLTVVDKSTPVRVVEVEQ